MSLVNKGFDGTVTEADFAMMQFIGGAEGVQSDDAWAVTQGSGRQVSAAAEDGWAFAAGVVSKDSSSPLTANLSTPVNGQWFLVVRRINYATNTVTLEAIGHSTTSTTVPTVPPTTFPSFNESPGTIYDQLLAWAWCRSTDTTVAIFDLRKLPLKDRVADVVNRADLDDLIKIAPVPEGRRVYVDELNCDFQARDGVWRQAGVAQFESTSERDAAYAKASGAFLVATAQARTTEVPGILWTCDGSSWIGVPEFPRMRQVLRAAAQSLTSGTTPTQLLFDTSTGLPNLGDIGFSSNALVVPVSGIYDLNAVASFAGNNTGNRALSYQVNGAGNTYLGLGPPASTQGTYISGSQRVALSKDDAVTLYAWQSSGGSLNLTGAALSLNLIGTT